MSWGNLERVVYIGTIFAGVEEAAYVYVTAERNGHAIWLKTHNRRDSDADASMEIQLLEYVSVHDVGVVHRGDTRDAALEHAVNYVVRERALRLKRATGGAS